jgi:WD40 repeat protein
MGYGIVLGTVLFVHVFLPAINQPAMGTAPLAGNRPAVAPPVGNNPIPPSTDRYVGQRFACDTNGIPVWAAFSPDGEKLAVGTEGWGLSVHEIGTGATRNAQALRRGFRYGAFSPDGERIVAGGFTGGPVVIHVRSTLVTSCEAKDSVVMGAAFTSDGKAILGAVGNKLVVWEANTGKRLRELEPSTAQLRNVLVCADGQIITAGHALGTRHDEVWSLEAGKPIRTLPTFTAGWNVANGKGGYDLVRKPATVRDDERTRAFSISRDGRYASVVTMSTIVWTMDLVAGKQFPDLSCNPEAWESTFAPDGSVLAVGKKNGTVDLFAMPGGEKLGTVVPREEGMIFSLAFASDGRHLAIGTTTPFTGKERKVFVVDLTEAVPGWKPRPAPGR